MSYPTQTFKNKSTASTLLSFATIMGIFVLSSFFQAAIPSLVFFYLILGLSALGALCLIVPISRNLIPQLLRTEARQKGVVLLFLGSWASLGLLGGFTAGLLIGKPVFFIATFSTLGCLLLAQLIRSVYLAWVKRSALAKHSLSPFLFLFLNAGYVGLGLHLTGLFALPKPFMLASIVSVLLSLTLSCCQVISTFRTDLYLQVETSKQNCVESASLGFNSLIDAFNGSLFLSDRMMRCASCSSNSTPDLDISL